MKIALSLIAFILFAVALNNKVQADSTYPAYPIASQFQANVTFEPGLYENDVQKFTGMFHYNSDLKRFALLARDSLRTSEVNLFHQDANTQYIMSEFGEFGIDCLKYSNNGFTGWAGSFVPPFGFDIQSSQYKGVAACPVGNCDVFETSKAGETATLYFEEGSSPNRKLVAVETINSKQKKRVAVFTNWVVAKQDASIFQIPSRARCRNP